MIAGSRSNKNSEKKKKKVFSFTEYPNPVLGSDKIELAAWLGVKGTVPNIGHERAASTY